MKRKFVFTLILCLSFIQLGEYANAAPKLTNKVKVNKDFKFMSDLRSALTKNGFVCTGYTKNEGVIGVREEGVCKFNGKEITIDLFADSKSAKQIYNAVKALLPGFAIGTNNNWYLIVDDEATAKLLSNGMKLKVYS